MCRGQTSGVEGAHPQARVQDKELLKPILQGSMAFTRHIDDVYRAQGARPEDYAVIDPKTAEGRQTLQELEPSRLGLVNGDDGHAMAADLTWVHLGKGVSKPCGVLLETGARDESLGSLPE